MMETTTLETRILAAVSYLIWPASLLIVLTKIRKDPFLRYHGYQALFFGICCMVVYLVVGALLRIIPVIGSLIFNLLVLGWVLLVIFLAIRSLQGEYFRIPLIYDLAQGVME